MTPSAPAISAPGLFRALALALSITALFLEANTVDFYNDEFLSGLLSARPQLARVSIGSPRFTGSPHFRISTRAVDKFFRVAPSRLQELSLRECLGHTTKLPASVASLSSLRVFRLCSKVLRSLPAEMCCMSALQELHLNCPLLQQLPETFGRLTRLEHLSFTDCTEMRRLPDSLGDLSSLTSLHVDGSRSRSRCGRRYADQSALGPSLKHLIICMGTPGNGRLGGTLSTRLCSLLSLTHLSIDCLTSSSHLPSSLGHVTNLRWLSLRGTWLCLPLSLSRLAPCLHSLKLHYSGSTTSEYLQRVLPSFLSNLTSLTNLHLRNMHVPSPRPPWRVCTPSARFT
ncbi:unnamed protein product [Closterium sp. Naga37s-1]|nr:unnamed protein product [Closterium sp. Naga37s-1]